MIITTKKIHAFFYYLLIIILVIIAGTVVISALEIPGGWRIFTVSTGSMSPTIPVGSLIITKKHDNYSLGDVVTFRLDEYQKKSVTHRISNSLTQNGVTRFATKGDANNALDNNLISPEQIIGKVVFSTPFFGSVIVAAKTGIGKVLLIIIPTILIISTEVQKIIKEIKNARDRKNLSC